MNKKYENVRSTRSQQIAIFWEACCEISMSHEFNLNLNEFKKAPTLKARQKVCGESCGLSDIALTAALPSLQLSQRKVPWLTAGGEWGNEMPGPGRCTGAWAPAYLSIPLPDFYVFFPTSSRSHVTSGYDDDVWHTLYPCLGMPIRSMDIVSVSCGLWCQTSTDIWENKAIL